MWTKWTSNLTSAQDKLDFERSVRSAKPVFERAIEILEEREKQLNNSELDLNSFGSPSWPYLQASFVGARREIANLKKLLTLDQKDI